MTSHTHSISLSPVATFLTEADDFHNGGRFGPFRTIDCSGARGLLAESIRSRIELGGLGLSSEKGSVVFWALPLETLASRGERPKHDLHLLNPATYPLLADRDSQQSLGDGIFKFAWDGGWHPQMYFRMETGLMIEPIDGRWSQAVATTNHITLYERSWYCFALVWNRSENRYAVYANGVRIAINNAFPDPSGTITASDGSIDTLFSGHPCFAFRDFRFFDQDLDEAAISSLTESGGLADPEETKRLKRLCEGEGLEPFSFTPEADWSCRWQLSLREPEHLDRFYVQGNQQAPRIVEEGLLIETPYIDQPMRYYKHDDVNQVYLWTHERFQGDLYLKFQFKPLVHGGLSLLCLQASGMQREDFMADYPLRTSGSMATVHLEDVRNYHWEFFREMNDTRNDRASHGLIKNPWLHPLAFACLPGLIALKEWHSLEFLQEGSCLRGAIDGMELFNVTDSPTNNNGPILDCGRIALRCMIRSKILYRNLEIWNREKFSSQ